MDASEQKLRDRQQDLIRILEAINEVLKTKAWQTLKELVFDGRVSSIEKQLLNEAKSDPINPGLMLKLQGELTWARRYADLTSYAEMVSKELQGIKDNQNESNKFGS